MGHTSEFLFGIFDELEKQLLIKKLMNWAKNNVRILILMLYFFLKKIEKHAWRYDFTHVYLKSWWYDLQFLRIRVWQTKVGNYVSAFNLLTATLLKTQEIRIWKNEKIAGDIILHMCTKNHKHMRYGFWDRGSQTYFFVLLGHFFALIPP